MRLMSRAWRCRSMGVIRLSRGWRRAGGDGRRGCEIGRWLRGRLFSAQGRVRLFYETMTSNFAGTKATVHCQPAERWMSLSCTTHSEYSTGSIENALRQNATAGTSNPIKPYPQNSVTSPPNLPYPPALYSHHFPYVDSNHAATHHRATPAHPCRNSAAAKRRSRPSRSSWLCDASEAAETLSSRPWGGGRMGRASFGGSQKQSARGLEPLRFAFACEGGGSRAAGWARWRQ